MKFSYSIGILVLFTIAHAVRAQTPNYETAPINYSETTPRDPVAELQATVEKKPGALVATERKGYLESLLKELKIPASSQTLVFSKTSFQRNRITPRNPRALYFNDDTYVGFVPGGDVIEIASTDPTLGTIFYTVDQHNGKIARQTENCLSCHGGPMTHDVPGVLVRSVFADSDGQPFLPAGTFVTTHASPLKERWGGWYVTGSLGGQTHMGNTLFQERDAQQPPDRAPIVKGDVADLSTKLEASNYLTPGSDVVALMVLEHQAEAHNRMIQAAHGTLRALRDEKILNDAMGEATTPGEHSESTNSRIKSSCEPLVEYLLFANETRLAGPVSGNPDFVADFSARASRDPKGRSLRDFDLKTRLFRYPCSYLIDSASFQGLPEETRTYVATRIVDVLSGKETGKAFEHLSAEDRAATLEILLATSPTFRDLK